MQKKKARQSPDQVKYTAMNWFVDYLVISPAFLLEKIRKGLGRSLLAS